MISQPLFFSFSGQPQFAFRGAIALISLLWLLVWHPSLAYSQQLGGSQTSAPSASGSVPSNRSVLKQGSQGDSVSDLQALLKLLGFYTGAIDGVYRDGTASAVSAFQQAAGLQADGIVGSETWARLLPPSPPASAPSSAGVAASTPAGGAIASHNAPSLPLASSNAFPSPTASPTANSSAFPSPTAQSPSTPSTPTAPKPAIPAASQNPTPQTSTPQTSTPAPAPVELPILRVGMRGPAVSGLQERLKAIGAFKGAIDGVFGTETQEAVKTAQRNVNLEADGIVGPATWTALLR